MSNAAWLLSLAAFGAGLLLGRWSAHVDRCEAEELNDRAIATMHRATLQFRQAEALASELQLQAEEFARVKRDARALQ